MAHCSVENDYQISSRNRDFLLKYSKLFIRNFTRNDIKILPLSEFWYNPTFWYISFSNLFSSINNAAISGGGATESSKEKSSFPSIPKKLDRLFLISFLILFVELIRLKLLSIFWRLCGSSRSQGGGGGFSFGGSRIKYWDCSTGKTNSLPSSTP